MKEEETECKCTICYDTGIVFDGAKDEYLACVCEIGKELNARSGGKFTKIASPKAVKKQKQKVRIPDESMSMEDMLSGMPYPDEDNFSEDEGINGDDY